MAEFEGKLNLNVETSEIEIKGKFKLTEDELDTVAGGAIHPSGPKVSADTTTCDGWEGHNGYTRVCCFCKNLLVIDNGLGHSNDTYCNRLGGPVGTPHSYF